MLIKDGADRRSGHVVKFRLLVVISTALLLISCGATPTVTETSLPPTITTTHLPSETPDSTVTPSPESTGTSTIEPTATTEGQIGTFEKWSKVEIDLTGPESEGMSEEANPFKILVDVTFTGPEGQAYTVPAFYAGDGNTGLDGNVWRVRFAPDAVGDWSFTTESDEPMLNQLSGAFGVTPVDRCESYEYEPGSLPDLSCVGMLTYTGEPFLKYSEGPYWLKGGADEPEDFLAPEETVGFGSEEQAIDYLAGLNVNSLYMLLHNTGAFADARNVWPWVGETESEAQANNEHFDIAKLERWEEIFTYLQEKGITLHLVFEDDSGWTGFNREMFYREMVARFGHHTSLIWNVSEEYNENYQPAQVDEFAQMIDALDAYDHPMTVHHGATTNLWRFFLGDENIDLTSLQTGGSPGAVNAAAIVWARDAEEAGRVIPISIDEPGEVSAGQRDLSRQIVWAAYMGQANIELFTASLTSYADFEPHFSDMSRARAFIERLPYTEMETANALLTRSQGYVLVQPDNVYVVYVLQPAEFMLDLRETSGMFGVSWFDPKTGDAQPGSSVTGGQITTFAPPFDGDNVLVLTTENGG